MDYSPFNAIVWSCFAAFCLVTWGAVRLYLACNPGYPGKKQDGDQ